MAVSITGISFIKLTGSIYPPGNMEDYKQLEDDLADCTTNSGDTLNDCLEDLAGRQSGVLSLVEIN